jgi:L-threonylcarbamoyladenylate synthase
VSAFAETIAAGGVVVFPADTVYGLACDPGSADAVERLYALKGRDAGKPAAVMFASVADALEAVAGVGDPTRSAIEALAPGPVTLLVANPSGRYPLACGPDPRTIGLRVPAVNAPPVPVLQSSANAAGEPDARRLDDVPADIRAGADLVLDGGELPGTPSTVVDLRPLESGGRWAIVREGAVSAEETARRLTGAV